MEILDRLCDNSKKEAQMEIEILYRPSYSVGLMKLSAGEQVRMEGGALVAMSPGVTLETQATGGLMKSLSRSLFGGESFFLNVYRAPAGGGEVYAAPALPGDLQVLNLNNENLMVQSGGYIASEMNINIETKWSGAKTFFASEGLIMLRLSGSGKTLVSSYGAIHELNLASGQSFTIDTGHLVAFTDGMGFQVRAIGGIKSTLFSGEGLVVDMTGPGKVLLQTRSYDAFLSWLIPKLPRKSDD
jgi:uncharacterized protein (TIGR00266 family)